VSGVSRSRTTGTRATTSPVMVPTNIVCFSKEKCRITKNEKEKIQVGVPREFETMIVATTIPQPG
jgi:hypothetical protein